VLDVTGGSTMTFSGTVNGSGSGVISLASGQLAIRGAAIFEFPAGQFQWTGGLLPAAERS